MAVLAFPLRDGEPLLPVEPVQILWINLIVAVALALPLALEAAEPELMERAAARSDGARCSTARCSCARCWSALTLTGVALGAFAIEHERQLDAGVADGLALARGADDGGHRRRRYCRRCTC